jgi:S-adenosylmethionine decarboxylase
MIGERMNPLRHGIEWLVDGSGCPAAVLQDQARLEALFAQIVAVMRLNPVGLPVWHRFPATSGITGLWMLQESHLTIHTFPEFGSVCCNVFCCTHRPPADWRAVFSRCLEASTVRVQEVTRPYAPV